MAFTIHELAPSRFEEALAINKIAHPPIVFNNISGSVFSALACGGVFASLVLLDFATGMAPSAATAWGFIPLVLALLALHFTLIDGRPFAACALVVLFSITLMYCYGLDVGYAVHRAGRSFPLVDATLDRIDRAFGYDWPAIFHFFADRPLLTQLSRIPYDLAPQQMLLLTYLLMARRLYERILLLISANFLALFLTHVIAMFMPALGTYAFAGLSLADHPGVDFTTRAEHVPSLLAARMAIAPDLDAMQRFGIVTFPSYHAVMIVLAIWASWKIPFLRIPALIWNAVILIATPVHGSHYLCDIAMGSVVAMFSIALAHQSARFFDQLLQIFTGDRANRGRGKAYASARALSYFPFPRAARTARSEAPASTPG